MQNLTVIVAILPISEEEGWDPSVKGVALSSFFWGYICTQILGALLANRFGGKVIKFLYKAKLLASLWICNSWSFFLYWNVTIHS